MFSILLATNTVTGAGAAPFYEEGPQMPPSVPLWTGLKDAQDKVRDGTRRLRLKAHLVDTGPTLEDHDMVLTGDLGKQGRKMLRRF